MLLGYLHPRTRLESFDDEGYFRTGDLGRWVDDEYLVVTGRAKDIIIRNGENISPKEVEDLLVEHPDIAEVAIVGVPDDRTGERACAVIVAAAAGHPDVATLREYLEARGVAKFKVPEQVRDSGMRCRRTTPARCSSSRSERLLAEGGSDMQVAIVTGASRSHRLRLRHQAGRSRDGCVWQPGATRPGFSALATADRRPRAGRHPRRRPDRRRRAAVESSTPRSRAGDTSTS